ncbi:hypothetical protein L3X38_012075 [Prunus dulcis]|uniref:Uncharacterized protein n=1 Tax=Prunus dulcis TaxID=3755 RepID=A0AAD4ZGA6_PRUDU|nr:hypothetical protein L3X38_012075 [Prunus dulcis]
MFTSRFVRPLSGQNCSFFSLKGAEVAVLDGTKRKWVATGASLGSFVVLLLVVAAYRVYVENKIPII